MAQTLQSWTANHPGVPVAGEGRWLVFKECIGRARRFENYYHAADAARANRCGCGQIHEVIELEQAKHVSH